MDPNDKLKRLMAQSGLFDSGEGTASDIGDYSSSSEDEWTPKRIRTFKNVSLSIALNNDSLQLPTFSTNKPKQFKQNETGNDVCIGDYSTLPVDNKTPDDSSQKSSITILADVQLPAFSNSFQLPQSSRAYETYLPTNSNNEQPLILHRVDTLSVLDSTQLFPFPDITSKRNKLNEISGLFESDSDSEQNATENIILNPESGLFESHLKSTNLSQIGKKRISRQEQWARTKDIKRNLKNHSLKDLPDCRCKCKEKLSLKQVQTVFNKFINLSSHTEQNIYLQGCLQEVNPKRFRPRLKGNETTSRARRVLEYVINLPKKSVNVCQKVFLVIHGIKRERLVCKVQHQKKDISDGRGRQSNPKIDVDSVNKVHKFIEGLPARHAHYSRASSKHRKFLNSHLSVAELHRKFGLQHPDCIVSYEKFRCIFNQDFNISFGQPRKDICSTCEKFKVDIASAELAKDTKKTKGLKYEHELHLRKAEVFLKTLSKVEKQKPSNSLSLCFDFQKNLPLPVTNITDEYYLRQLWLHNFGVHNQIISQNTASMFLFTENYAHKGPNEVITALEFYIAQEKTQSQHQLNLYCDNCYSQNKNRYLFTFLDQLCAKVFSRK